ncbi:uncharacterized protein KQ657_002765 [Scheffersomyces spartinae]|uniref:AMP-dependent synthetase/ligase domain-containing protein n=1 Tax=Scheffersomyces spartinae TaxID=45513 RepID=A0A9P8AGU4_9ASCO|nr:uncharacterized protein KQ657_002765 [Scheffersomyces spartinae]KAG7191800.1 hypothetical protein KQ657_002765 [Scheffersomyces spartinae]
MQRSSENAPLSEVVQKMMPLPIEKWNKGIALEGTEEPGYSAIYRNGASPEALKSAVAPGLSTYKELFKFAVSTYQDKPLFSYLEYDYANGQSATVPTTISYNEADHLQRNLGSGIVYLLQNSPYLQPQVLKSHAKVVNHSRDYQSYDKHNHSFVLSLFSGNRWEWAVTDMMSSCFAITNTVLYDTLGPNASEYILSSTESPIVVCSKNHIRSLVTLKKTNPDSLAPLVMIVSMDPLLEDMGFTKSIIEEAKLANIDIFSWDQVIEIGKVFPHRELDPTVDSLFSICFTSGTTGNKPKGVLLEQRQCAAGITFALSQLDKFEDNTTFCFLPLAHIFQREMLAFDVVVGSNIGFPRLDSSPLTLVEDLKIFRPTSMANVPRVFTKFEAVLKAGTIDSSSVIKRTLFSRAFNAKLVAQAQADGCEGHHFFYDTLLISKLRNVLGFNNMRYNITGSAPISPSTVKFLKAALGIGLAQGYGLTESFAGFAIGCPYEKEPGSCGPTGVGVEVRIREIPEMGYTLDDPKGPSGELLLRGPQITPGYYKNPEETAKSFDKDGWFLTGDIARISASEGKLYIVDRVKNFFKLSQGEYVTPEKVENVYLSNNSLLQQCYVHGDSLRSFLVAVIGIPPATLKEFLTSQCGVSPSQLTTDDQLLQVANNKDHRKKLLHALNKNIASKLQGFEKVHNVFVEFEPLQLSRDVVTPTMKLRRPVAAKYFANQIDEMYTEGSLISKSSL